MGTRTKSATRDECMNIFGDYRLTPRSGKPSRRQSTVEAQKGSAKQAGARDPRSPKTPPPSAPPCSPDVSTRNPAKVVIDPPMSPSAERPELRGRASSEERILLALAGLRASMINRLRTMSAESKQRVEQHAQSKQKN